MIFIQSLLQSVEVGKSAFLVRIIPLITALIVVVAAADFVVYKGLGDQQSMDNAQLARQIVRGHGYTTQFLRPHAVSQMRDFVMAQSLKSGKPGDLFPSTQFPPGTPRVIPDTYNPPVYPYLLATWFFITHPEFEQTAGAMSQSRLYSPEKLIPLLNQVFLFLTAVLIFIMGRRLFDDRVAWMAMISFLVTELVWRYSLTALSTTFLMFLVTAILLCLVEIMRVSEASHDNDEISFAPAWIWAVIVAGLLGVACLTRLNMLVFLVPMIVFLAVMPKPGYAMMPVILIIVAGIVAPWFFHLEKVSGNPLGSNTSLMLYGQGEYKGNQIYCTTSIPNYERLFKDATHKETSGFRYHFEHAWTLMGSNPLIILFVASLLHQFKRRRTRVFHWLLVGCAFALVAMNNLGVPDPQPLDPWNIMIVLLPCMLVIGGAFFFILLDRLNLQLWLLNNLIVTITLVITALPLTLLLTLGNENPYPYNFPPYWPPAVKSLAQTATPDEWVTTDMPWATAWYADRASLWLPDSINDFENLHDNVCPTGALIFTRLTWDEPVNTYTTGEYKDWLTFVIGVTPPSHFPLTQHMMTPPGGPDMSIWSDRPRWMGPAPGQ